MREEIKCEVKSRKFIAIRGLAKADNCCDLFESYYHVGGFLSNRSGDLVVIPVGVVGFPKSNFRDSFWRELFAVYELPVMIDMYIYKRKRLYIPRTERLAHLLRDRIDLKFFTDSVDILIARLSRDSFFANGFASLG